MTQRAASNYQDAFQRSQNIAYHSPRKIVPPLNGFNAYNEQYGNQVVYPPFSPVRESGPSFAQVQPFSPHSPTYYLNEPLSPLENQQYLQRNNHKIAISNPAAARRAFSPRSYNIIADNTGNANYSAYLSPRSQASISHSPIAGPPHPIQLHVQPKQHPAQKVAVLHFGGCVLKESLIGGCAWWLADENNVMLGSGADPVVQTFPTLIRLEYEALLNGLKAAFLKHIRFLRVIGSSEMLIHNYVNGEVKLPYFQSIYHQVDDLGAAIGKLLPQFRRVEFQLVPPDQNAFSQKLAHNIILNYQERKEAKFAQACAASCADCTPNSTAMTTPATTSRTEATYTPLNSSRSESSPVSFPLSELHQMPQNAQKASMARMTQNEQDHHRQSPHQQLTSLQSQSKYMENVKPSVEFEDSHPSLLDSIGGPRAFGQTNQFNSQSNKSQSNFQREIQASPQTNF